MGSVHTEVGDAVCALTTMLSSMRDIVALVGRYDMTVLSTLMFSFHASKSCLLRRSLWPATRRSPSSLLRRHGRVRG